MPAETAAKVSQAAQSSGNKIKDLFRKYGKVAIGVHFCVYFTFWAGCYVAINNHVDVRGTLERVGLLSAKRYDETAESAAEQPADQGWLDKVLSGSGSTVALAFLCNKALFPVRTPITIGLTPMVARLLRSRAAKMPAP